MPAEPQAKRSKLVAAAAGLFHRQGIGATTLADVAREAGIPPGNVYYYFKTKDALAEAVFDHHQAALESEFAGVMRHAAAADRLAVLLESFAEGAKSVADHGCPYGSLNLETGKARGPLAKRAAALFTLQLDWFAAQFREMGQAKNEAIESAQAVLCLVQGAFLVGHALKNPEVIRRRLRALAREVRAEGDS
jgi:TetR/AcrR family transcriptional repressor of nem operon